MSTLAIVREPEGAPPHDLDAEASVLSAVLVDLSALEVAASLLRPEDFYAGRHSCIFAAALALRDRGETVDAITVQNELRNSRQLASAGGAGYLTEILNVSPSTKNVGAHAHAVRKHACDRRRIDAWTKAAAELRIGGIASRSDFLAAVESSMLEIDSYELAGRDASTVAELMPSAIALVRDPKGEPISTGFGALDAIFGGFNPEGFTVVAARTSEGKSVLIENFGRAAAKAGHGVFVASLEMSSNEFLIRGACAEAGLPAEKLVQRRCSQTELDAFTRATERLVALPMVVDASPSQSVLTVRTSARRAQGRFRGQGKKLGLVIVDFLQLVKPVKGGREATREQDVAEIARQLKVLAKDLGVHVVAACQLNDNASARAPESKRPRLSDLRESKAIGQLADLVLFIHRDVYDAERDNRTGWSDDTTPAEIIVAKNRSLLGRTGVAKVAFQGSRYRFVSLARGEE